MCLAVAGLVSAVFTVLGPLKGASDLLNCLSLSSLDDGAYGVLMKTAFPYRLHSALLFVLTLGRVSYSASLGGPVTPRHLLWSQVPGSWVPSWN